MRSLLISLFLFLPAISIAEVLTVSPGHHGFRIVSGTPGLTMVQINHDVNFWDHYPSWGDECNSPTNALCIPRGASNYAGGVIPPFENSSNLFRRGIWLRMIPEMSPYQIGKIQGGPGDGEDMLISTSMHSNTRFYRLELDTAHPTEDISYVGFDGSCHNIKIIETASRGNFSLIFSADGECDIFLSATNVARIHTRIYPHSVSYQHEIGVYGRLPASEVNVTGIHYMDRLELLARSKTGNINKSSDELIPISRVHGMEYNVAIDFKGKMSFDIIDWQPMYNMSLSPGQEKDVVNIRGKLNTNSDYVTARIGNCSTFHGELCALNKNGHQLPIHAFISPAGNPSNRHELRTGGSPPIRLDRGPGGFFELNKQSLINLDFELWREDLENNVPPSDRPGEFTGTLILILESSF